MEKLLEDLIQFKSIVVALKHITESIQPATPIDMAISVTQTARELIISSTKLQW